MSARADLRGPLAARLAPVLAVVACLVALSAPIAYHAMGCGELRDVGARDAARIADELAREAEERPVLWRYDTIRLLEHLRAYETRPHVARIDVVDRRGVAIGGGEGSREGLLWARAAIATGGEQLGDVWVGMDPAPLRARSAGLFAAFALLAIALVAAVHAIVMRSASVAESRIDELVDRLAEARADARARELGARAVIAQEEERRAIARDLHDSVGQALTAIRIQAELLSTRETDRERVARRIAETSDATIEDVRRAIARLGPAVLDELGLERALARLIEDAAEGAPFTIEARVEGASGLPAALESTCYRIVQEALTNAARHAAATRVEVTLARADGIVSIEVRDDGRGARDEDGLGVGLRAMRERAELLGGTLAIDAAPGGGTTVRATLPVAARGAEG